MRYISSLYSIQNDVISFTCVNKSLISKTSSGKGILTTSPPPPQTFQNRGAKDNRRRPAIHCSLIIRESSSLGALIYSAIRTLSPPAWVCPPPPLSLPPPLRYFQGHRWPRSALELGLCPNCRGWSVDVDASVDEKELFLVVKGSQLAML